MVSMLIAGVDEVGRGSLAGPMVAGAVILDKPISGLKDSKMLKRNDRERLDLEIKAKAMSWAIGSVSVEEIDRLGIVEANKLVMRRAIMSLNIIPRLVRCDGYTCGCGLNEVGIIKGDQKYPEISAASIIAKVYRDDIMRKLNDLEPRYGFSRHVGYGTPEHLRNLSLFGPSIYHRKTFKPIGGAP